MSNKKEYAQKLLDFLYNAPTPFQSNDELEKLLINAGAVELCDGDEWNIERGKTYYIKKEGTQIAAFRLCGEPKENGFRIAAAHQDAPGFRIKSVPSTVTMGYERLCLETYGGTIIHGWLDRPLAVAGRIFVKDNGADGYRAVNVNINKPIIIIPSAAIHVKKGVNDGQAFSVQKEMCPFFTLSADGKTTFKAYIAEYIGVKEDDILSMELAPYDFEKGHFIGLNEEFISTPRLDDCAMAHSIISAVTDSDDSTENTIAVIFDHEEIGSGSDRGAKCNTLRKLIDRICEKLGYSAEDKYRALSHSMIFSADMAHATHPSYQDLQDPNLKVMLGKGPAIKMTYTQAYSTSARGTAFFKSLCERNDIPYQEFNNNSDTRGGGTIGPMMSAELGVCAVDLGNPTLSMHAVRELGGTDDVYYMQKLFTVFFQGK